MWGATGLSLLVIMPPLFWLTSLPSISMVAVLLTEGVSASTRFGVMFLVPIVACFALVLSYTLLYLGRVLVSSALGEVHHPRWPSWDLEEMFRGVCRWFWAIVVGVGIGVIPAAAYWISCGDLDPLDIMVLVDLLALGAAYAQMALLATHLARRSPGGQPDHGDPGDRPDRLELCPGLPGQWGDPARCGSARSRECSTSPIPCWGRVALWAFWVMVLYLAMVALRVLGLCYHHRSRALGWFGERPRWGV